LAQLSSALKITRDSVTETFEDKITMKKIQKIIQKVTPKRSNREQVPSTPDKAISCKRTIHHVESDLAIGNYQQFSFSVDDFQKIYCNATKQKDSTKIVLKQEYLSHFYAIFEDGYIQRLLQVDCCYLVSDVNNLVLSFIFFEQM